MEFPVRTAWCNLKFTANGGQLTPDNFPILSSYEIHQANPEDPNDPKEGTWIHGARGYCDRGYDCDRCGLLQDFVAHRMTQGYTASWECTGCAFTPVPGWLSDVPGLYTSHLAEGLDAILGVINDDPICPRCENDVPYLQLVLRIPG